MFGVGGIFGWGVASCGALPHKFKYLMGYVMGGNSNESEQGLAARGTQTNDSKKKSFVPHPGQCFSHLRILES